MKTGAKEFIFVYKTKKNSLLSLKFILNNTVPNQLSFFFLYSDIVYILYLIFIINMKYLNTCLFIN